MYAIRSYYDLFNRVSWQIATRTGSRVFAWLPLTAFVPPSDHPLHSHKVIAADGSTGVGYARLSPFSAEVREYVAAIYEDLGRITSYTVCYTKLLRIRLFGHMTALENVMVGRHVRTHAGVVGAVLRDPKTRREEAAIHRRAEDLLHYVGIADRANDLAKHLSYSYNFV